MGIIDRIKGCWSKITGKAQPHTDDGPEFADGPDFEGYAERTGGAADAITPRHRILLDDDHRVSGIALGLPDDYTALEARLIADGRVLLTDDGCVVVDGRCYDGTGTPADVVPEPERAERSTTASRRAAQRILDNQRSSGQHHLSRAQRRALASIQRRK